MFRSLIHLVPCLLAVVAFAGAANAQSVPYKEKSAGALTTVAPDHVGFAAKGQATHFGLYTIVGGNDLDALGNVLNGQLAVLTADGATIQGVYSGTYTPLPTGEVRFEVSVTWFGGTGRLSGVTGQASVDAMVDAVAPGAGFSAEGFGSLLLN
jgi:hypothetical protein